MVMFRSRGAGRPRRAHTPFLSRVRLAGLLPRLCLSAVGRRASTAAASAGEDTSGCRALQAAAYDGGAVTDGRVVGVPASTTICGSSGEAARSQGRYGLLVAHSRRRLMAAPAGSCAIAPRRTGGPSAARSPRGVQCQAEDPAKTRPTRRLLSQRRRRGDGGAGRSATRLPEREAVPHGV